jgi:two-component system, OmpR family, KDP operon response regulator KdpE
MSAQVEDDPVVNPFVLVVDDDRAFRGLAARLLAGLGIGEVVQADSVASALQAAEQFEPIAALVDVGLPDGDGVELAALLLAATWAPRVVLTSSDTEAATRSGAIPFIAKDQLADGGLQTLLSGGGE